MIGFCPYFIIQLELILGIMSSSKTQIRQAQVSLITQADKMIKHMQKQLDLRLSAIMQTCKTKECRQSLIMPYKKMQSQLTYYWATVENDLSQCIKVEQAMGNDGYLYCLNGVERLLRHHQKKNVFFKNMKDQ